MKFGTALSTTSETGRAQTKITMGAKKHGPSKDGMRAKYLDQVVPGTHAPKERRDALNKIYEANRFSGGILQFSLSDVHVHPCAPHVLPKEYKSGSSHVSFPSVV